MSLRSAFAWSLTGQMMSFAATFGATVLLTRMLTAREIGIYAAGVAVVGVMQAISAFGVGNYVIREEKLTPGTLSTAFTLNGALCVVLAAIVFAAGQSEWVTDGEPTVRSVLLILAIVPLLNAFELRPATMLQREMNFRVISLVTTARAVAGALVSIAAAWWGAGALSAAYGGLSQAMVGAVCFSIFGRRHVGLSVSLTGWRRMISFGFQTLAISGVSTASARASDFVLGRILGFAALGVYSRASALSNTIYQNFYGSLARALFPRLAEDDRKHVGSAKSYLIGLDVILALLWPLLVGLAILAGPVILLLFGDRWLAAAPPLALLLVAQAICLSFAMNHELFILRDRLRQQTWLEMVRSVVALLAFIVGCTFGLVGAAVARVFDAFLAVSLFVPLLPRLSGATRRELLITYVRALALTAAATAPVAVVMADAAWSASTPLPYIAVAVGVGIALWTLLLAMMGHPLFAELTRLLHRLRNRRATDPST